MFVRTYFYIFNESKIPKDMMNQSNIVAKWQTYTPQMLSLLRIVAAVVFIQFGTMKLFGWPIALPGGHEVDTFTQLWFAGILEAFGGMLLLIGLYTRPIAFILAGQMAVAYFQAHAPKAFWTVENGGSPAVLFCFVWLFISVAGAGAWSVDALLRRK